jgi:tRNA (mo5U34)-methyltransferase
MRGGAAVEEGIRRSTERRERVPEPTDAEREVADLLPIAVSEQQARETLEQVPLWFHTFNLDGGSLYTPGVARDHRYRIPALPQDLSGMSVLDVGTFDGFYAFLAESRGATRVVAIDNEQYRDWVRARWGAELVGGEGFRAIAALLGSRVSYRRLDAFDLDQLDERFDLILCFGILHRVEHPLGLLKALRQRVGDGGEVLVETYGVARPQLEGEAAIQICEPGEVYARDDFVYWAFTGEGLGRLVRLAGFARVEVLGKSTVDGHPRIIASLS